MRHTQTYQACISWQAQAIDGQYWQIVTHKGECFATVSQPITQKNMTAQQAAQLMADAPLLLNELKQAHAALMTVMMMSKKKQLSFEKLRPAFSHRVTERLSLLDKYSDLMTNKESGHE